MVFIKSKHVLPDNIAFVKDSLFYNYKIAFRLNDNMQAVKIISNFYENNFQNKKVKISTPYYALNPDILWFIKTTRYYKYLTFGCFMSNNFFTKQIAHFCYNNCIYSEWYK